MPQTFRVTASPAALDAGGRAAAGRCCPGRGGGGDDDCVWTVIAAPSTVTIIAVAVAMNQGPQAGLMEIEGKRTVVRKHDVIYIPAGVEHALYNTGLADFTFIVVTTPVSDD